MTENGQIIRRLYEDCINTGRLELLTALVADDYMGPTGEKGPSGFAETIAALRSAFPDIRFTVEDVIAEGRRVAIRWAWRGTHLGQFRTFAPTGKTLTNTGIAIYEITDGRISRAWLETDRLGALQQMGVIPM
jgi:steroid delta-isomerase-like uncharacterized protein